MIDPRFARKLERLAVVSRRVFAGKVRGERRSTRRGGSVEFADYRAYAPGDDFRAVDWHAYARLEHLFLKLFAEEEDLAVHVLVDASASMGFPAGRSASVPAPHPDPLPGGEGVRRTKIDAAKELAAALAYVALAAGDRASVAAFRGGRIEAATPLLSGKRRIFRVIEALAEVAPGGATGHSRAADLFCERGAKPGVAIVISDLLDPDGYERGLLRLRYSRYEPLVLQVLSADELDPEPGGDLRLVDAEGAAAPVDISLDRTALRLYRTRLEAYLAQVLRFCRAHEIGYCLARADLEVEELVMRSLRAARFVA